MSQPNDNDNDTIQLFEDAVRERLPHYANEDDMYAALDQCGLTQRQIFDELDRRGLGNSTELNMALETVTILFEAFDDALETIIAHKVPLYG
jgi:hypothetical protein